MIIKILTFFLLLFIISTILSSVFIFLTKKGFIAINELTPNIDETKEILRGNTAVSEYFSRILSALILGISIIISISVIAVLSLIK